MKRTLSLCGIFMAFMLCSSPEFLQFSQMTAVQSNLPPYLLAGTLCAALAFGCGLLLDLPLTRLVPRVRQVIGVIFLVVVLFFVVRWCGIWAARPPQPLRLLEIHTPKWTVNWLALWAGTLLKRQK